MIVDIHIHTFPQAIAAATIEKLAGMSHLSPFTHGSNADLAGSEEGALLLASLPNESAKMALTVITMTPVLAFYPFFQKYFVKGLTLGSVKG